jgi:peptidoglycan/xylan/chitin deacetylase (PgdA/CDA1 family)
MSRRYRLHLALAFAAAALLVAPSSPSGKRNRKKKARGWWATLPVAGPSDSGAPELILTFDDGPHEKYTPMILDELKKRNIKAVFFWVGYRVRGEGPHMDARRALIKRALDEGHIIANHTVTHPHLCHLTPREAGREIDENEEIYRKLTGLDMRLIRIPFGDYCRKVVRLLEERNLPHVHWDIDPMEWVDHDAERVYVDLRRKFRRLEGRAVVLMHDTKRATTIALPRALAWIDRENERRRKAKHGKKPIRFLDGRILLHRVAAPKFREWVEATGEELAERAGTVLAQLLP